MLTKGFISPLLIFKSKVKFTSNVIRTNTNVIPMIHYVVKVNLTLIFKIMSFVIEFKTNFNFLNSLYNLNLYIYQIYKIKMNH